MDWLKPWLGLMVGIMIGWLIASWGSIKLEVSWDVNQSIQQLVDWQSQIAARDQVIAQLADQVAELEQQVKQKPATKTVVVTPTRQPIASARPRFDYTGEDLWQAVNKYRREHGVPELKLHSQLCQLSSYRLNQLIDLGKLDNHQGFKDYFDQKDISDWGLSNVAENLAYGYPTAWDTVMGWDSSPPHRTFLLADGSFVYGCASANQGFAVLIAGF